LNLKFIISILIQQSGCKRNFLSSFHFASAIGMQMKFLSSSGARQPRGISFKAGTASYCSRVYIFCDLVRQSFAIFWWLSFSPTSPSIFSSFYLFYLSNCKVSVMLLLDPMRYPFSPHVPSIAISVFEGNLLFSPPPSFYESYCLGNVQIYDA